MYATQLQQQNHQHQLQELCRQHHFKQTALNLASLHSVPIDYARLAHFPNRKNFL